MVRVLVKVTVVVGILVKSDSSDGGDESLFRAYVHTYMCVKNLYF